MDRREFIKQSSIVGGVALSSLPTSSFLSQSKFKMGYQLYSIRDEMAINPIQTLKDLKSMEYEDFEIYGFDAEKGMIYGHRPKELLSILQDLDLTVTSGHYGFSPYMKKTDDELKRFVDQCIQCAMDLKSDYITWPWLAPELRTMENFKLMTQKLNLIGEQVTNANLGFAYHNHGFEFEDHDGENCFDHIIDETDPSIVKLEMDMYWVMHSSEYTPQELIDKQPGRYVMWHIKDMDKVTRDYTELGNGSIDYIELLPDPVKSGLQYYYLEQGGNYAINSKESALASAKYFKDYLSKKLD